MALLKGESCSTSRSTSDREFNPNSFYFLRLQSTNLSSLLYVFIGKQRYSFLQRWFKLTLRKKCPYSELFWSVFSAFGLNTERHGVSLRIQSECGKMRTWINPNTGTFHAVLPEKNCSWNLFRFNKENNGPESHYTGILTILFLDDINSQI